MDDSIGRLSDDLLRHILQFVPAKEGVITTALSKRWRHLWRASGAVNLMALILEEEEEEAPLNAKRDRFVSQSLQILDSFVEAGTLSPLNKVTVVVEARNHEILRRFLNPELDAFPDGVLPLLLAHQVVRTVHVLRIQAIDKGERMLFENDQFEPDQASFGPPIYNLSLSHLPRQHLRVLDLSDCGYLGPGQDDSVDFPHLHSIRLNHCTITRQNLNKIAKAAPSLTTVRLEFTLLDVDGGADSVLVFPAATSLLIYMCCITEQSSLVINTPMLREFGYKGISRKISLLPPPEGLLRVGLDQIYFRGKETRFVMPVSSNFWNFLRGCIHARRLNVTMWSVDVLAQTRPNVKLMQIDTLELNGVYWPSCKKVDLSIGNFLKCCPALRNLRINLTTNEEAHLTKREAASSFLAQKFKPGSKESLKLFSRYEIRQLVEAWEDSEDSVSSKRPRMEPDLMLDELNGLTGQDFKCLETSLASLALQFRQGEKCPFGVNLLMFFAQHGKVLEEIWLESGLHDHLNAMIDKWLADRSGRRMPDERREKAGGH